ncbi:MAG: META domain-containing protein [Marinifilaceae bacterium]
MKKQMYFIVVALVALLASCGTKETVKLQGHDWILSSIEQNGTELTLPTEKPTIMFDDSSRIAGFAGCNRFFGKYTVKEREMTIELVGTTQMACPDMNFETAYLKMLGEVKRFDVVNGELRLKDFSEKVVMKYIMDPKKAK